MADWQIGRNNMSQFYGKVHYRNTFDEGAVQKMTYNPADLDIDNPGGYNYEFTPKIKTLPIMSPHDAATFAKFPKLFALSSVPGEANKRKRRKPAKPKSSDSPQTETSETPEGSENEQLAADETAPPVDAAEPIMAE